MAHRADVARTALDNAIKHSDLRAAQQALADLGQSGAARLLEEGESGWTFLHKAAAQGSQEIAWLLLRHAQDPDMLVMRQEEEFDQTPLHLAARGGFLAVAKVLLKPEMSREGALLQRNKFGFTSLQEAARMGHMELAAALARLDARCPPETIAAELLRPGPQAARFAASLARAVERVEVADVTSELVCELRDKGLVISDAKVWAPSIFIGGEPVLDGERVLVEGGTARSVKLAQVEAWSQEPRLASSCFALLAGQRPERMRCEVHALPCHIVCSEGLELLQALAATPNGDVLGTATARGIVAWRWESIRRQYYLDILLASVRLAAAIGITHRLHAAGDAVGEAAWRGGVLPLLVVLLIAVKDAVEELGQLLFLLRRRRGLASFLAEFLYSNTLDIIHLVLEFLSLHIIWASGSDGKSFQKDAGESSSKRAVVALWVAFLWIGVLLQLRCTHFLGLRMLPIFEAIRDIAGFALVLGFCIAAATHAYFVLALQDEPGDTLYAPFLQMWRLAVLGDFDMSELEGEGPRSAPDLVLVHLSFIFISTAITVVLMNLFVGILSNNYDKYEAVAAELLLRKRARLILEHQARPWPQLLGLALQCGGSCYGWLFRCFGSLRRGQNAYQRIAGAVPREPFSGQEDPPDEDEEVPLEALLMFTRPEGQSSNHSEMRVQLEEQTRSLREDLREVKGALEKLLARSGDDLQGKRRR